MDFKCKNCETVVPEEKFTFSARAYQPLNTSHFSVIEIKCPVEACSHIQASAVIPPGLPFAELPEVMKATLRGEADKLPKVTCQFNV